MMVRNRNSTSELSSYKLNFIWASLINELNTKFGCGHHLVSKQRIPSGQGRTPIADGPYKEKIRDHFK